MVALPITRDVTIYQSTLYYQPFGLKATSGPAAPWTATSPYQVGDVVTKATGGDGTFLVTTAGTTGASEPTWPTADGGCVTNGTVVFMRVPQVAFLDTTSYDARWKIRDQPSGTVLATGSNADGRVETG